MVGIRQFVRSVEQPSLPTIPVKEVGNPGRKLHQNRTDRDRPGQTTRCPDLTDMPDMSDTYGSGLKHHQPRHRCRQEEPPGRMISRS